MLGPALHHDAFVVGVFEICIRKANADQGSNLVEGLNEESFYGNQ